MPIDLPCSGCRRRLSVREEFAGRQVRCPACGALVTASPPPPPAPLLPGFAGPFFAPPGAPPAPLDAPQRGWSALFLSPAEFFAGARTGPLSRAARVGLPCLVLGSLASSVQMFFLLRWAQPSLARWMRGIGFGEALLPQAESFGSVLRGQVGLDLLSFIVFPLALHVGVRLAGGRGLRQTVRIYFYSLSARGIDLLPFGFVVSWVYLLVLAYLGLRGVHSLSEGRSIGALVVGVIGGAIAVFISLSAMMLSHGISQLPIR